MGTFKTIRRFGAGILLTYAALKIGSCCYTTYNKMEEDGSVNATQYALSEIGTHLKNNGKRLQEIGESLERLRPEEKKESDLENKVNPDYNVEQPTTRPEYELKPVEQVQQPKPEEKGWLRTAIDYFWR